jgi:hypothetical protein
MPYHLPISIILSYDQDLFRRGFKCNIEDQTTEETTFIDEA